MTKIFLSVLLLIPAICQAQQGGGSGTLSKTAAAATYVPYTGATKVLGMGAYGIITSGPIQASSITITAAASITGAVTVSSNISGNYLDREGFSTDTGIYSLISEMDAPLTSGVEISNILGRIRWKHAGNSNAILNGVEGVCSSTTTDESITCRGGSFRTYTATGGTIRTSVGADMSVRAGIPGASDIVAEAGTGFIGARIRMAPGFTPATLGNLTNSHGLWIYNEHATNAIVNGLKIDVGGGAGFTNDINLQNGETINNAVNGRIAINGALQGTSANFTGALEASTLTVTGNTFSVGATTFNVVAGAVGIREVVYNAELNIGGSGGLPETSGGFDSALLSLRDTDAWDSLNMGVAANNSAWIQAGAKNNATRNLTLNVQPNGGAFSVGGSTFTVAGGSVTANSLCLSGVCNAAWPSSSANGFIPFIGSTAPVTLGAYTVTIASNVGVGTTTPYGMLSVMSPASTPKENYVLLVGSTTQNMLSVHANGNTTVWGNFSSSGTTSSFGAYNTPVNVLIGDGYTYTNTNKITFGPLGYNPPGAFLANSSGDKIVFRSLTDTDYRLGYNLQHGIWVKGMSTFSGYPLAFTVFGSTGSASHGPPAPRFAITNMGYIGIGVINPTAKLEIRSTATETENVVLISSQNASTMFSVNGAGMVWISSGVSAASYITRSPYPETLALAYAEVDSITRRSDNPRKVDHEKLHSRVKAVMKRKAITGYTTVTHLKTEIVDGISVDTTYETQEPQIVEVEELGQDLTETISAQNDVIKDLIKRIDVLEKR